MRPVSETKVEGKPITTLPSLTCVVAEQGETSAMCNGPACCALAPEQSAFPAKLRHGRHTDRWTRQLGEPLISTMLADGRNETVLHLHWSRVRSLLAGGMNLQMGKFLRAFQILHQLRRPIG